MNTFTVICKGREETARVAGTLAPLLRTGDSILLKGALASGKTAFVQDLVAALGSQSEVTSPTFTIAQFYPMLAGTFLHIDAYRLSSVAEFRDLALEVYIAESITAVEWGEIVEHDFPDALTIDFEFVENQDDWRRLTFSAKAERWQPAIESLRTNLRV